MENERELTEEELMKIIGGYKHMNGNEQPIQESELYGQNQKEKLEKLKEELQALEENNIGRSRR